MKTSTISRALIVATAVMLGASFVQATPQRGNRQATTTPQARDSYSREEAQTIATRLYRAVLDRDGTAAEISRTTADIQRGNLATQVNGLVSGVEFRRGQERLDAAQLLERFYQRLLDRAPDSGGVEGFLPLVEQRRYADVILGITRSAEFRERTLGTSARAQPAAPVTPAAPSRLTRSLDCQARALDAARGDANGLVFWSFDRLPETPGDTVVSGPGVDRFDNDRHLTYRCDGNAVTYVYDDRGRVAGADRRLEFPSGAVRACVGAARDDRGRQVTFDAASLSATDTRTEYVIGLAANTDVRYVCEMDGTRVVRVDRRP